MSLLDSYISLFDKAYDWLSLKCYRFQLWRERSGKYYKRWNVADNLQTISYLSLIDHGSKETMYLVEDKGDGYFIPSVTRLPYSQESYDSLFSDAENITVLNPEYVVDYSKDTAVAAFLMKREQWYEEQGFVTEQERASVKCPKKLLMIGTAFGARRLRFLLRAGASEIFDDKNEEGISIIEKMNKNQKLSAKVYARYEISAIFGILGRYAVRFSDVDCDLNADEYCSIGFDDAGECNSRCCGKCREIQRNLPTNGFAAFGRELVKRLDISFPSLQQRMVDECSGPDRDNLRWTLAPSWWTSSEFRERSSLFTESELSVMYKFAELKEVFKAHCGDEVYNNGIAELRGYSISRMRSLMDSGAPDDDMECVMEALADNGVLILLEALVDGVPLEDVIA